MTRIELKEQAKNQIKGKIWTLFLVSLIVFGVSFLCTLIPVVGGIVEFCLASALTIGMIMIYLKIAKGEEFQAGDVFEGCHVMGKAIWLNILVSVFTALWSLLLIIPGIIKAYSYSMASYILAENPNMKAREALEESMRIMDGHKMDLFILQLSFIGWAFVTGITFGLAGIYVIPYMQQTFVNFYNSIKKNNLEVVEEK